MVEDLEIDCDAQDFQAGNVQISSKNRNESAYLEAM
jgi:hypothetical protein